MRRDQTAVAQTPVTLASWGIGIGGLALVGWSLNIAVLKAVAVGNVSMNPVTAITCNLAH